MAAGGNKVSLCGWLQGEIKYLCVGGCRNNKVLCGGGCMDNKVSLYGWLQGEIQVQDYVSIRMVFTAELSRKLLYW